MATHYHGGETIDLTRPLWVVGEDGCDDPADYASYFGPVRQIEVNLGGLTTLDLTGLGHEPETEAVVEALAEAGIATDPGLDGEETHQRVMRAGFAEAARAAGYSAVRIAEWVYERGRATTLLLLDPAATVVAVGEGVVA